MKKLLSIIIIGLPMFGFAQLFPNLGGQRAGISALTFLKNDLSPRSIGMAGANVSANGDGYAMNVNPAALVDVEGVNFTASNLVYVAGMQHSWLSAVVPTDMGSFSFSANNLYSGPMAVRTEFQPEGTGQNFFVTNSAFGVGYAKSLSNMFSFGVQAKYVLEQIADYSNQTLGVDMGFLYRTDYKGLKFAVSVANFGTNSSLDGSGREVDFNNKEVNLKDAPMPTLFKFGASINAYEADKHLLIAVAQLNHPNDNAENIRLGLEYSWANLFFARTGLKINVDGEPYPTGGVGLNARIGGHRLRIDYGVNPTQYLGLHHGIGLSLTLNRSTGQAETPIETPASE